MRYQTLSWQLTCVTANLITLEGRCQHIIPMALKLHQRMVAALARVMQPETGQAKAPMQMNWLQSSPFSVFLLLPSLLCVPFFSPPFDTVSLVLLTG